MSDNVRAWLDHTHKLDQAATEGPWEVEGSLIGPDRGAKVSQAWGTRWRSDAEWIAHARTALPAAVAALRAVIDLHQPDGHGQCVTCLEFEYAWGAEMETWPCPTVQAVHDAIEKGNPA